MPLPLICQRQTSWKVQSLEEVTAKGTLLSAPFKTSLWHSFGLICCSHQDLSWATCLPFCNIMNISVLASFHFASSSFLLLSLFSTLSANTKIQMTGAWCTVGSGIKRLNAVRTAVWCGWKWHRDWNLIVDVVNINALSEKTRQTHRADKSR